jgi:putative heme transporter
MAVMVPSPPSSVGSAESFPALGGARGADAVPADFTLPALDLRLLARRAALPAALAAVAALALILAGGPLQAFADALRRALTADARWVTLAGGVEIASFGGYIALLWLVGGRATERIGLRESVHVTLGGTAATRLLPTAGVGGAALTLWAFRRAGLGGRAAARTLLAFLVLLYAVFLASIAVTGTLIAAGAVDTDAPLALSAAPAAGAWLAMAAALALAVAARRPPVAHRTRLGRIVGSGRVLGEAVGDAIGIVRSADPRALGAVAWWAFDAAALWAMLHAFGAPPALGVVVLAYFVGQVANTIPIPGAVSGGTVGVLLAFGVAPDLALTAVLAYRAVAIWVPAPMGLVALGGLRRTVARWKPATA